MTNGTARAYVSTYAKYASGSLAGEWVSLDEFSSADDFIKHCRGLFSDEDDPEIMFQDWEGVPKCFHFEGANEKKLERLFEFLSLEEFERRIIVAHVDATGNTEESFEDILDRYAGCANSEAEFAEQIAEECGHLKGFPDWIVIDWEETWSQYLQYDFYVGRDEHGEKHFFHQV